MPARPLGSGVIIRFDQQAFARTMRALRSVDKATYDNLRRTMRVEAGKIKTAQATAVRALKPVGSSGTSSVGGAVARQAAATSGIRGRERANHGLRDAVARGLKIEYRERATARRPFIGIRVRLSGSTMPPGQGRLPKHMNYGRWRHPVFGDTELWRETALAPVGWFDGTFAKHRGAAAIAIGRAIDAAFAQIK